MSEQKFENYFEKIDVKFDPKSKDPLHFKHYDPNEKVLGKSMKDWLRFSICYWHTWRGTGSDPFGESTIDRPWEKKGKDETDLDVAIRRLHVHFSFLKKIGVEYYAFHDRDIAPEGQTIEETNKNLDILVSEAKKLQKETGIKLLWGTANLFSNKRYMNGAITNPDLKVVAFASQQVKKCLEITKELGGENYVFWGGREGYQTLLNTSLKQELDHIGRFFQMAVTYKNKIGFNGTLLIEPKPREPMKHQYDFDSATTINFLKTYNLEKDFKLNIECNHATLSGKSFEHEIALASAYGMMGSIDANVGDLLLGWDTDQFLLDTKITTQIMLILIKSGGFKTGGLNFDAKIRRESTDIEDLFIAHISSMDAWAAGLKKAAEIIQDGKLEKMVKDRYSSFETDLGKKFENGETTFEEMEQWLKSQDEIEPKVISGKQEKFESVFYNYFL